MKNDSVIMEGEDLEAFAKKEPWSALN